jgi:hypothetical protein
MDDWAGVDLAAAQRSSLVGATSSWRIGQRWRSVGIGIAQLVAATAATSGLMRDTAEVGAVQDNACGPGWSV